MSAAITVKDLEKVFRVYARPSDALRGLITRQRTWREHRAVDGISFEIPRGQTLGIVGQNGAGKSTLLKILAGALNPSAGTVLIDGRVSAILELGSGLHPDFSGRENIFFGGLCMGLSRREIESKFDEIVDFSELEDVLDRPFRTYSTGMQARLSFSIAASVNSDVMIVDEALSVGDARFQLKCFQRFEDLRKQGTTILLVSHNMSTIIGFCDRAILIEKGRLIEDGSPQHIDRAYQKLLFHSDSPFPAIADQDDRTSPNSSVNRFGDGKASIVSAALLDEVNERTQQISSSKPFRIEVKILLRESIPDLVVGLLVRSPKGIDLFGIDTATDPRINLNASMPGTIYVWLEGLMHLAQGDYFLTAGLAHRNGEKIDLLYDAIQFRVVGTERLYTTSLVNFNPTWTIEHL